MKLKDILPPINVDDDWGRSYKEFIPRFIQYAKERKHIKEWEPIDRNHFLRSVNCVSSLKQGNFYHNEREIIQNSWDEFIKPLEVIVTNPDKFCKDECYEIVHTIKRLINSNKPSASLRFLAAFQPSQLCTIVSVRYLDELYYNLQKVGIDLPNYCGDTIMKSNCIQSFIKENYPEVDVLDLGTYPWRINDLLKNNFVKNSISNNKDTVTANICKVEDLFKITLTIPPYQRPYRWDKKNVKQLLDDITNSKNDGKQRYRIGSVILYKNESENYEIVDGQQRITTLLLLAKICGNQNNFLDKLEYRNLESRHNIVNNYGYIEEWIKEHYQDTANIYWEYVENNCEFVVVVVNDLSEAFQMFDSQNGRGKELESYNLLKAYHIRAMEQDSYEVKVACDKRWEAATMYDATPTIDNDPNIDILRQIFDEQLYRGRIWSKGKEAHKFKKSDIDEFKGFTIDKNHSIDFPFQNPYLLQYLTAKFYNNILAGTTAVKTRFKNGDNENIDPFVNITQQIVNGKAFFDYVETYVEIYKQLFINLKGYQLKEFKEFYYKYCLNYDGQLEDAESNGCYKPIGYANRSGDSYLREAYKTTVLLLFDKFGERGLNKYYKVLYKLIYSERLINGQVRRDSVSKLPIEYISIINQAQNLADLVDLEEMWMKKKIKCEQRVEMNDTKGIENIKSLFK
jgi:hypothetical protein